jgi:hypothetical protein
MVEGASLLHRRLQGDLETLPDPVLTDELVEAPGAKGDLLLGLDRGVEQAVLAHG